MSDLVNVSDLCANHIGSVVRVQNAQGGFIEGTLAVVSVRSYVPHSDAVVVTVGFEEFILPRVAGEPVQYMTFSVSPNGSASVVED